MGIMNYIAKKKKLFKQKIKENQDAGFKRDTEKLKMLKTENKELEKRDRLTKNLEKETAKRRKLKYGKVSKFIPKPKTGKTESFSIEQKKSVFDTDRDNPFSINSENPFARKKKRTL